MIDKSIDNTINKILDELYNFIKKQKLYENINGEINFSKNYLTIISYIDKFIKELINSNILNDFKALKDFNKIMKNIKYYITTYIFLGISYYYTGNKNDYASNLLEISHINQQPDYIIWNNDTISKLIMFHVIIKQLLYLNNYKNIDKIKNILLENTILYEFIINFFNELGEKYIIEYFLIQENFHNIIKSLILKELYLKIDKKDIINIIYSAEEDNEYKYIDIIVSSVSKMIDYSVIQDYVKLEKINVKFIDDIYSFISEYINTYTSIVDDNNYLNNLLTFDGLIPLTEDYIRYHKDTEKYTFNPNLGDSENIKEREATKIKYIITKMKQVINYYSIGKEIFTGNNKSFKGSVFYASLMHRLAVLFNDNEEIKIINKLKGLENISDYELLVELDNYRKYVYGNFKNYSDIGIRIYPCKNIECIRLTNTVEKEKYKNNKIETRIGNENIEITVVGIVFNPSKRPLWSFKINDLIDVTTYTKHKNGYESFCSILEKKFSSKTPKLYYWKFNSQEDKLTSITEDKYIDTISNDIIKIMIENIYKIIVKLTDYHFNSIIKAHIFDNYKQIEYFIKLYNKRYNSFIDITNLTYELLNKILITPKFDIVNDKLVEYEKKTIKLPTYKSTVDNEGVFILKQSNIIEQVTKKDSTMCIHYSIWANIMKIRKTPDNLDMFNQKIFDFIKTYAKLIQNNEYICKSCNELLEIKKFIVEGTYDDELDTFLTTTPIFHFKLEELPKYNKFLKFIKNIEKIVEIIAYIGNINILLGSTSINKLRRRILIKDLIDLLLVHNEYLKKQPNDRINKYNNKYNIDVKLSNLFYFDLTDDILLTISSELDDYKIIKYNNVLLYLLLIIFLELNIGHIINLTNNTQYNYYIFEKIKQGLFGTLYIRINEKDKLNIINTPILAYLLYYWSGVFITNKLWLYNIKSIPEKDKKLYTILIQKTIIHTFVDLLNSIIEASLENDKDLLYDTYYLKITKNLYKLFNEPSVIKQIEENTLKRFKYDTKLQQITLVKNTIEYIEIGKQMTSELKFIPRCTLSTVYLNKIIKLHNTDTFNQISNCPHGDFHRWKYNNKSIICDICKKEYDKNTFPKFIGITNSSIITTVTQFMNRQLVEHVCIDGHSHTKDKNNTCSKCKINFTNFNPSINDINVIISKLDSIKTSRVNAYLSYFKIRNLSNYKFLVNRKKSEHLFKTKYKKHTNNNLNEYIINFIDSITKILGESIIFNNKVIYFKETEYIIDHDYLGNSLTDKIILRSSQNKVNIEVNHPLYKKDVYYYKDNINNVIVLYDYITLQYIGYVKDNKIVNITKYKPMLYITLSIEQMLLLLGCDSFNYNIDNNILESESYNWIDLITNLIRVRITNLKQLCLYIQTIIYCIYSRSIQKTNLNTSINNLISEFITKIKSLQITDITNKDTIFKYYKYIQSSATIYKNIPSTINTKNNNIELILLNNLNNTDCMIIFYIIDSFKKLIHYNDDNTTIYDLISKLIIYLFNEQYKIEQYETRKFKWLLQYEKPYTNDEVVINEYQELVTIQELESDELKEEKYTNREIMDSLDIDDYDANEDEDDKYEVFDGYEE